MTIRAILKLSAIALAASLAACSSDDPIGAGPKTASLISIRISGEGTVTSQPTGISCSHNGGTCAAVFNVGDSVTLTATPAPGSRFRSWVLGLCPTPGDAVCTFTVTEQDRQEVAVFETDAVGGLGDAYAITQSNKLVSFNRSAPGTVLSERPVSGLLASGVPATSDELVGLAFRAINGTLYALAKTAAGEGRLYLVNRSDASLVEVGPLTVGGANITLSGNQFGLSFDPITDRLRVISDAGENLTIDPSTGATTTLGSLGAGITAAAHTNAFHGTKLSTLYALNSTTNELVTVNGDALTGAVTIAAAAGSNGFEIDGRNGQALILVNGTNVELRSINLTTGTTSSTALVGLSSAETVRGLALTPPGHAEILGVTAPEAGSQKLIRFSPLSPADVSTGIAITGLAAGERVVGLEIATNGTVYALGDTGQVYALNPFTGAASSVAAIADATLRGPLFGMSFDAAAQRLRVVSSGNDNLAIDPATGAVTRLADIGLPPVRVTGAAYSDNYVGATTQTLYGIDSASDQLLVIDARLSLNNGRYVVKRALGFDATDVGGFEIVGATKIALAAVKKGAADQSEIWKVDLDTGAPTLLGDIGIASTVVGIAMQPASSGQDPASSADVWGVTASGRLIAFARDNPGLLTVNRAITGLTANVVAVDFRPADSSTTLHALTDTSQICAITLATAAASCGNLQSAPTTVYTLEGTHFGFDWDPSNNIWRIVSDTNENLAVDPITRHVQAQPRLNRVQPKLTAVANTNSFAGAAGSVTYVIDAVLDEVNASLGILNPATGRITNVGSLGERIDAEPAAFDILGGHNGLAVAALRPYAGTPPATIGYSRLYRVDLATGSITSLGNIGKDDLFTPQKDERTDLDAMALRFANN